MALRLSRLSLNLRALSQVRCMSDTVGSGSGKGGGGGGSVREAGGSMGKREAAREEEYFRRLQADQLRALKSSIFDEIKNHEMHIQTHEQAEQLKKLQDHHTQEMREHEAQIKQHEDAIRRHKDKIHQLKDLEDHD